MHIRYDRYYRDPIHGYIGVFDYEQKIIDHPLFQRLRRIHQLGFAYYVFHGAEHSRFGHSLGVLKVVDDICKQVGITEEDEDLYRKLRIAGLLHDIGHTPYSHTLEPIKVKNIMLKHEKMSVMIIKNTTLRERLLDEIFSRKDVDDIINIIEGGSKSILANQIIHSELDADRMDYLLRDSLYCGVKYGIFDYDRLVLSLRIHDNEKIAVEYKGLEAAEEFILARLYMYLQVYTHKTNRGFGILAKRLFELLINEEVNGIKINYPVSKKDLEDLVMYDDYWFYNTIREVVKKLKDRQDEYSKNLRLLGEMLLHRIRLKEIITVRDFVETGRSERLSREYYNLDRLNNNNILRQKFLDLAELSKLLLFVDFPEAEITQTPYYYVKEEKSEDENLPIYIIKNGELNDIAQDPNTIISQISRRKAKIARLYTIPEKEETVRQAYNKLFV